MTATGPRYGEVWQDRRTGAGVCIEAEALARDDLEDSDEHHNIGSALTRLAEVLE